MSSSLVEVSLQTASLQAGSVSVAASQVRYDFYKLVWLLSSNQSAEIAHSTPLVGSDIAADLDQLGRRTHRFVVATTAKG